MAFRINKGIFQFSDGTKFINKFKIDDNSGELVEVDPETGDPVDGYLRTSGKAADANLLDGINSSAFLRSNTADTASARIDFTADESIRFKGARGQFTNEYIHLYNKVGIGHPSGWGQGQTDTPDKGISTYGGANFAYGNNAQSSFKGSLRVDANWGANDYAEAFTIRGTYPSIALRSTTHNAKWLIHNDNNVSWYYGSAVDTADWGLKFRIATNGNIWMSWAGGWLSDLLNAKEDSGVAQVAIDAAKEELLNGAISTAQTTADTALARADGAKGDTVVIGELATAAQAAADAAQATADSKLGATAKAADSNLLDGIDSSAFLRSNTADTFTGTLTMGTQKALVANNYGRGVYGTYSSTRYQHVWSMGTAYNLADDGTGAGNLYGIAWTHQNIGGESISGLGHQMLIMSNGDTRSAIGDGIWTKYNLEVGGTTYINNINTKNGSITNNKGSYLHLGGWAVGRTHASAVLVNTAYRADYATSLFDMNISRFTNNSGYITQAPVDELAEGLRLQINNVAAAAAAAQTTADGKLGATAKAADADKLDGLDSSAYMRDNGWNTSPGMDANTQPSMSSDFSYANNAPHTGDLIRFGASNYSLQLSSQYNSSVGALSFRTKNGDNGNYNPWRQIWHTGNFDPSTKLDTGAKAADADKLDGYDWMQSGKSVRANEFYADNWFRNYNSNEGLYNQATGQHWYSDDDDYWNIAGGTAANGIRFRDEHAGTIRGYVYANSSNQVGFLDAGGSWAVRHFNDHGTYFYTDDSVEEFKVGRDAVTGDYGTVQTSSNKGGWGGYSIYGQYVLMSNGSRIGIYNDIDNEWMLQCHRNAQTELYHNGSRKLYTNSGGVTVTGTVTATSFSGSGAGLTNLPVVDQTIPVTINGEGNDRIVSINMNLDRGQIEFTLTNGQTFTAMMGR